MINKIECICKTCNKTFFRIKSEVERNKKINRSIYCSRKCSGIGNKEVVKSNLKNYLGNGHFLKSDNKKDIYTPYRYFLRCSKRRNKEVNLTLEYLKNLWEEQKGICPLTGKSLYLEHDNNPYQASLDRIDSSKGYVIGNVRYIALIANYCKNIFSDEQVIEFCNTVVTHNLKTI